MKSYWEYHVETLASLPEDVGVPHAYDHRRRNRLNELGQQGWELVSVVASDRGYIAFLKRPSIGVGG